MIRYVNNAEEFTATRAEAAAMSATCPLCAAECVVRAAILQATRREPAKLLCFEGWCSPCQIVFPLEQAQMRLST